MAPPLQILAERGDRHLRNRVPGVRRDHFFGERRHEVGIERRDHAIGRLGHPLLDFEAEAQVHRQLRRRAPRLLRKRRVVGRRRGVVDRRVERGRRRNAEHERRPAQAQVARRHQRRVGVPPRVSSDRTSTDPGSRPGENRSASAASCRCRPSTCGSHERASCSR